MSEVSQKQESKALMTSNTDYTDFNTTLLRLSNDPLWANLIRQLSGKEVRTVRNHKTREQEQQVVKVGEPLLNNKGVQHTINYMSTQMGAHTVLGNLDDKDIDEIVFDFDTALNDSLILNQEEWDMSINSFQMIHTAIVNCFRAFISRTKEGFENNNMVTKINTVESSSVREQEKKKFLGMG